jgi:hypothetical protein
MLTDGRGRGASGVEKLIVLANILSYLSWNSRIGGIGTTIAY